MKINFQKLMRVLPSFVTVLAVLCFCVMPAFAYPADMIFDAWDYAEVTVDGFSKVVTVTLPDEVVEIALVNGNWVVFDNERGNDSTFEVDSSLWGAWVFFCPLGDYFKPYSAQVYESAILDISAIPSGSSFSFDARLYGVKDNDIAPVFTNPRFIVGQINPTDGKLYKTMYTPGFEQVAPHEWVMSYDLVIEDTSLLFVPEFAVGLSNSGTGTWRFDLVDWSFTTTIDALADLERNTEETNRILDVIREQLNINNQNWQDFLDGKAEWQDIVDTSTDKVEDAVGDMNEIGDALATVPKPEIDIDTLVPDELAGQEYLNYINVIQQIWSNPLISSVAYIMGCLLVISYLLFGERG